MGQFWIGGNTPVRKGSRAKRGPVPKVQQQLEQIDTLPKAKQRAIAQVLDSMLGNQAAP